MTLTDKKISFKPTSRDEAEYNPDAKVLCMRVEDLAIPHATPSEQLPCSMCGKLVWKSATSPDATVVCMPCFLEDLEKSGEDEVTFHVTDETLQETMSVLADEQKKRGTDE